MNNQEVTKLLKKAKRKNLIRTVIISGIVSLVLIMGFGFYMKNFVGPTITDSMDVHITYPGGGREAGEFIAKGDKEIKVTSICYDKLGSDQTITLSHIDKGMFTAVAQATIKCSKNSNNPTTNVTLFNNQKFPGAIKKNGLYSLTYLNKHYPSDTDVEVEVETK
ncbi:hypothetical protein [Shimazuella kribbensis]|uniref:hypothetical protein n=1 Tax=Shimazuella kribbensis TaxID=139808 RepID=UPI0003FA8157|nr:hypothetical protein [Shimazuella kribbensis]